MIATYTVPQFRFTATIIFGAFKFVATSTSKTPLRYVINDSNYTLRQQEDEECNCEMCRLMEEMEEEI
jgi:hypothetical protein